MTTAIFYAKNRTVRREVNNKEGERKEKAVEVWWDEECRRSKRKVKEELEKWREGGGSGNEYKKSKKEYKKLCDRKKEEEKRKWEKEVEQAKTKGDVWKIVNKGRKERRGVDEKIEIREWKEYFRGVLGGIEWRVGGEVERSKEEDEEKEMEREEFEKVIKKLKKGKAAGSDDIENEIWREEGEEVKEELWEICKRVWKGEGFPEEWREGIVVPVLKKGKGEKVKEYRGATLTQTGYKVYASVLEGKIREEVEEKKIVPQSQAGFRRYMGTLDQIYVLNQLINRRIGGKEGKLVIAFIDMKEAVIYVVYVERLIVIM
ncbi:golgin subfamily A member 6-like protein 22 [Cardiocondyla obscurior]|uniref:golgin subfamily A member 6-like protein 22 n=1 Tax=Cardiocondyla obscurior TaxID=286306 RepID=UPI0039658917